MKLLIVSFLSGFLVLSACSSDDAVRSVADGFEVPDTGGTGTGGEGPDTEPDQKQQVAQGKLNGFDFEVVEAGLFVDPFNSSAAELILTNEAIDQCWHFYNKMVFLPIADKTQFLGEHVVSAEAGSSEHAIFYDNAGGENINAYVNKSNGMRWTLSEDENGDLIGVVEIPPDSETDDNHLVGTFPIVNCL